MMILLSAIVNNEYRMPNTEGIPVLPRSLFDIQYSTFDTTGGAA